MNKIKKNRFHSESFCSFVFYLFLFLCLVLFGKSWECAYYVGAISSVVLFIVMWFFYDVCGCHINPIISFALLIKKKIKIKEFWKYIAAQAIGAFLASLVALGIYALLNIGNNFLGLQGACNFLGQTNSLKLNFIVGILIEFMLSFIFVITYLFFTKKYESKLFIAICISLCLLMINLFGYNLTTACINPLKSIVSALVFGLPSQSYIAFIQMPIFIIVPLLASFCAVKIDNKISGDKNV